MIGRLAITADTIASLATSMPTTRLSRRLQQRPGVDIDDGDGPVLSLATLADGDDLRTCRT